MLVYHYHPETKEYLGSSEARESPLEPGVFLIPACATDQKPPTPGPNQIVVFAGSVWTLVDLPLPPPPPPAPTPAELKAQAWARLRTERNGRLAACDWTQLSDVPLSSEQKAAWAMYRQALRDLPYNTVDPVNPIWPTPPGQV